MQPANTSFEQDRSSVSISSCCWDPEHRPPVTNTQNIPQALAPYQLPAARFHSSAASRSDNESNVPSRTSGLGMAASLCPARQGLLGFLSQGRTGFGFHAHHWEQETLQAYVRKKVSPEAGNTTADIKHIPNIPSIVELAIWEIQHLPPYQNKKKKSRKMIH